MCQNLSLCPPKQENKAPVGYQFGNIYVIFVYFCRSCPTLFWGVAQNLVSIFYSGASKRTIRKFHILIASKSQNFSYMRVHVTSVFEGIMSGCVMRTSSMSLQCMVFLNTFIIYNPFFVRSCYFKWINDDILMYKKPTFSMQISATLT